MHPDEPTLQVSHETIYTALYAMPRGRVAACLRQGPARVVGRAPGAKIAGEPSNHPQQGQHSHAPPPEIDERVIPGHWEGALIKGARNVSAVGTLVERTTLFVALARMDNATADAAVTGFGTVLNRIDVQRRLSLTYDQGRVQTRIQKMAQHERLSEMTGVNVYFADPHSPWQRGINENTNGLLRQYFPKETDLSGFTQAQLDAVAWQLNTRPRKSLDWKCPAELFMPESFNFLQHHHQLVALRT